MARSCEDQQAAYLEGDPDAVEHLSDCVECLLEKPGLDDIRTILSDESTWIEPAADLEARIVAATTADELSGARARRTGRRGMRRSVWLAAAACLIGGGIGAGTVAAFDTSPSFGQQVALGATSLAPNAKATVHVRTTSNGLEIHLDVTGLPTAPAGSYYEAWLKGPSGLVPIGTFHTGNGQITLWSGVSLATHPTFTVTIQSDDGNPASSGRQVLEGTLN
jgi:Anti-sigma-K factor rskA